MENTSASLFGQFVQKHNRELIDNDNDFIVAHELFHHWFGDLVTCESWANLTLNEGFANYSEYLWAEHNDGRMRADHHRLNEMEGYISSGGFHPLIHYRYADKENMFDAHSYNKGGMVLHMLRNYVGDKAFFKSLNKYLLDNQFSAVEVDELRMAFEDVTGEDLNWFFDQWYLQEGHPIVNVKYEYVEADRILKLTTFQVGKYNFNIPYNIAVYDQEGNRSFHTVWTENEMDTFYITNINRPSTVVFDGTNTNLAIITEEGKSEQDYLNQFKYSDLFLDKYLAFNRTKSGGEIKMSIALMALDEPYYLFREMALDYFMQSTGITRIGLDRLQEIALNDPHSSVRLKALQYLSMHPDQNILPVIDSVLIKEQSYPVISFALAYLSSQDYEKAEQKARELESEKTAMLNEGIAAVYSQSDNYTHTEWFERQISTQDIFENLSVYMGYTAYTLRHNPQRTSSILDELLKGAIDMNNGVYQRYFHTLILSQIKGIIDGSKNNSMKDKVSVALDVIKDKEQNPMLQSYYRQM
jgi:aminopeptidase N